MSKILSEKIVIFLMGIIAGIILLAITQDVLSAEIYQGYFITNLKEVQYEQTYKEITSYTTVDVYAELTDKEIAEKIEPTVIGTKEVPVYTIKTDKWTTKRPALDTDLKNWQDVGEYGGKRIFYVTTQDKAKWEQVSKHADYIGASIREITLKSNKDPLYIPIAQRLLYNRWYTGALDENKNQSTKRGDMADWIAAGKPKLIGTWNPKLVYAGVPCAVPIINEEANELEIILKGD